MPSIPPQALPTDRAFLTSLFASFANISLFGHDEADSLLRSPPPALKSLLLTLHVIFPNELLPALDLLDRRLVMRLSLYSNPGEMTSKDVLEEAGETMAEEICEDAVSSHLGQGHGVESLKQEHNSVYYVQSSQSSRSRFAAGPSRNHDALGGQSYEVRLKAWNCTCPAFAFASIAMLGDELYHAFNDVEDLETEDFFGEQYRFKGRQDEFGALLNGNAGAPMCKHLLACLLVERWAALESFVESRQMTKQEMSGWAAGWGG